jgi:hypothetical protein
MSEKVPVGHTVQLAAESAENVPATHGVHIIVVVAVVTDAGCANPVVPEYEPFSHVPAHVDVE